MWLIQFTCREVLPKNKIKDNFKKYDSERLIISWKLQTTYKYKFEYVKRS